jgi:hypothetical protein
MDKQPFIPHGKNINAIKSAGRLSSVAAARGVKAKAKTAGMDAVHGWESSFHAERGCLDGGLPLQFSGQIPRR